MPPWRQRTYDPPQFNPYSEKEATLAGQEWDMQRMGQHPGIPGFEALMAESLEALWRKGYSDILGVLAAAIADPATLRQQSLLRPQQVAPRRPPSFRMACATY